MDVSEDEVRRAMGGDQVACTAVCLALLPRLHALARRVTGRADLAEEATQEAILRVIRGLRELREPARLESWALTIAGNVARNLVSRARPTDPLEEEPPAPSQPPAGPDEARDGAVQAAVRSLAPDERELFLLHTVEDVPLRELALANATTEGAMKARVHRIRAKVRSRSLAHLEQQGAR